MSELKKYNNGNADAAPAIQEMLDKGGDVRILAGTYLLKRTLRVKSNTNIIT